MHFCVLSAYVDIPSESYSYFNFQGREVKRWRFGSCGGKWCHFNYFIISIDNATHFREHVLQHAMLCLESGL
jgi:hypothetical protein